jgi:SAM-dependent methyltransferase
MRLRIYLPRTSAFWMVSLASWRPKFFSSAFLCLHPPPPVGQWRRTFPTKHIKEHRSIPQWFATIGTPQHPTTITSIRTSTSTSTTSEPFLDHSDNNRNDPFAECWAATSWTVSAGDNEEINEIVRCFNSPAPPVYFALTRALALTLERTNNDNNNTAVAAVAVKDQQEQVLQRFSYMLKKGYQFAIRRDLEGSIAEWRPLPQDTTTISLLLESGWEFFEPSVEEYANTLQIAHHLLDLVTEASEHHERVETKTADALVNLALDRLQLTLGLDIRGRSSADAAFAFAMAGVAHPKLYQTLATICWHELRRIGARPSFPSKNILQIVEKLAAAGLRGPEVQDVYTLAAELLTQKDEPDHLASALLLREESEEGSFKSSFGLHSTRSLLWLWRFAARQTKAKVPLKAKVPFKKENDNLPYLEELLPPRELESEFDNADWVGRFEDPSRPLIVDVGCGMGVSLLGLATANDNNNNHHHDHGPRRTVPGLDLDLDYSQCNFVGGDLSQLLVGYSRGIALRWELDQRAQFVWQPADALLRTIQSSYPHPNVAMIMIQFPTPFRLAKTTTTDHRHGGGANGNGNKQLPSDASSSSGFMVSLDLLRTVADILKQSGGSLLLQSNCEDVAVAMRDMAVEQVGMVCVDAEHPVEQLGVGMDLPQRTQAWMAHGGARPIGPSWSSRPFLPRVGQTETEVACELQGTPVHRCLLKVPSFPSL